MITNQSGVARGYYTEKQVIKLHKKMNNFIFKKTGYRIDNFEYCPYLRSAKIKKYKKNSYRRKPNPGMINDYLKKENLKKKPVYYLAIDILIYCVQKMPVLKVT